MLYVLLNKVTALKSTNIKNKIICDKKEID